MISSLGLYKEAQVAEFVDVFSVIVILEKFSEGLVVLKHILGWDFIDLTYLNINDSHGTTLRRSWDGKPVIPSPKIKILNLTKPILVQRINELTKRLDQPLYSLGLNKFNKLVLDIKEKNHEEEEEEENYLKKRNENMDNNNRYDSNSNSNLNLNLLNHSVNFMTNEKQQFESLQNKLKKFCQISNDQDTSTTSTTSTSSSTTSSSEDSLRSSQDGITLTRADFEDTGQWTQYLTNGWKKEVNFKKKKNNNDINEEIESQEKEEEEEEKDANVLNGEENLGGKEWVCRWYALTDLEYEKQIKQDGHAPIVMFSDPS